MMAFWYDFGVNVWHISLIGLASGLAAYFVTSSFVSKSAAEPKEKAISVRQVSVNVKKTVAQDAEPIAKNYPENQSIVDKTDDLSHNLSHKQATSLQDAVVSCSQEPQYGSEVLVDSTPELGQDVQLGIAGNALKKASFVTNARPNFGADYFVFFRCAEWCAPCAKVRPIAIAEARKMMTTEKVSFVYVSHDTNKWQTRASFNSKYKAKDIPVIMADDLPALSGIPAYSGVPKFFIINKDGNYVTGGHGEQITNWMQATKMKPADVIDDGAGALSRVANILKRCNYFTPNTPKLDAEYYIFLQTASWCTWCRKEMPDVVKIYRDMQQDGRVELLLLSGGEPFDVTYKWMRGSGAKFAGTGQNKQFLTIPGFEYRKSYPSAYVVRADGTHIVSGHSKDIIHHWQKYTVGSSESSHKQSSNLSEFPRKLKKFKVINSQNISDTADYYIMLTTGPFGSTQGAAQSGELLQDCLNSLADAYKKRQGVGEKVELILVAVDPVARNVNPSLENAGVTFPVILQKDPALMNVEDYMEPAEELGYVVLDKEGAIQHYGECQLRNMKGILEKLTEFIRTGKFEK